MTSLIWCTRTASNIHPDCSNKNQTPRVLRHCEQRGTSRHIDSALAPRAAQELSVLSTSSLQTISVWNVISQVMNCGYSSCSSPRPFGKIPLLSHPLSLSGPLFWSLVLPTYYLEKYPLVLNDRVSLCIHADRCLPTNMHLSRGIGTTLFYGIVRPWHSADCKNSSNLPRIASV